MIAQSIWTGMAGVQMSIHCALFTFPYKSLMALSSFVTNSSLLEAAFAREYWVRRPLEKMLALNKGNSVALSPGTMLLCSSFSYIDEWHSCKSILPGCFVDPQQAALWNSRSGYRQLFSLQFVCIDN